MRMSSRSMVQEYSIYVCGERMKFLEQKTAELVPSGFFCTRHVRAMDEEHAISDLIELLVEEVKGALGLTLDSFSLTVKRIELMNIKNQDEIVKGFSFFVEESEESDSGEDARIYEWKRTFE